MTYSFDPEQLSALEDVTVHPRFDVAAEIAVDDLYFFGPEIAASSLAVYRNLKANSVNDPDVMDALIVKGATDGDI